jgi:type I restriction-modification system DNA methylase subunit
MNADSDIKSLRKNGHYHSDADIKSRGEVFTPTKLVKQMLSKLPKSVFTDPTKTFLDNSCGNGQFLIAVLMLKMAAMANADGRSKPNYDDHKQALQTIYGCELDANNAEECRTRLLVKSESKELRVIVDHNIICADALDPKHEGWKDVGFYWNKA